MMFRGINSAPGFPVVMPPGVTLDSQFAALVSLGVKVTRIHLTGYHSGSALNVGALASLLDAALVSVNDVPYTYQVLATDTLASVAAALGAAVPGAAVAGEVLTIGGDVYACWSADRLVDRNHVQPFTGRLRAPFYFRQRSHP